MLLGNKIARPTKPYQSASFLSNQKQRDLRARILRLRAARIAGCILWETRQTQRLGSNPAEHTGNEDGKDEAAEAVIPANMQMPIRPLQQQLASLGIKRGTTWISKARARVKVEVKS